MIIQPGLTQTITDVLVPAGEYISVGNVGNDATTVLLEPIGPVSYDYYTEVASLSNSAETFGPYPVDRTVRIVSGLQSIAQYDVGANPTLRDFPPLTIGSLEPVALVEPAATFVTLTYNNNAGNVRLASAGAHGLTAAIAVGASVYTTWTGGTGVTGFYEVTALDADTTGVAVTIDLPYVSSTVTITIAAPGVVTWTAHGLSVNDTIRFTTTGALPTGLAINTTYYVKEVLSANTFTVSTSAGGAAVTTSGTQSGTQTALVWYGTAVVAVANTAVTLASVTVPGWSVGTGGEIEIDALFSLTNSANAKNLNMTFGGSAIFTLASANVASVSVQKNIVNRGGSQIVSNAVSATGHGASTGAVVTLSVNTTVDQTFAITAQPATANELVQLEYYNMHVMF
jgi:hypothetical protein